MRLQRCLAIGEKGARMQHSAGANGLRAVNENGVEFFVCLGDILQAIGNDHLSARVVKGTVGDLGIIFQ